jgi:hypothetical protein
MISPLEFSSPRLHDRRVVFEAAGLGGTHGKGYADQHCLVGNDPLPGIGSSAMAGLPSLKQGISNQPNRGPD